ncbi:MAG: hypothetical protein U0T32_01250 [Chitinophagales bacterium]
MVEAVREFYKKDYDTVDIREADSSAISIRIQEPVFESQTKNKTRTEKLLAKEKTMKAFIYEFLKQHLDNYLHKNAETADALLKRICNRSGNEKKLLY